MGQPARGVMVRMRTGRCEAGTTFSKCHADHRAGAPACVALTRRVAQTPGRDVLTGPTAVMKHADHGDVLTRRKPQPEGRDKRGSSANSCRQNQHSGSCANAGGHVAALGASEENSRGAAPGATGRRAPVRPPRLLPTTNPKRPPLLPGTLPSPPHSSAPPPLLHLQPVLPNSLPPPWSPGREGGRPAPSCWAAASGPALPGSSGLMTLPLGWRSAVKAPPCLVGKVLVRVKTTTRAEATEPAAMANLQGTGRGPGSAGPAATRSRPSSWPSPLQPLTWGCSAEPCGALGGSAVGTGKCAAF